MSLLVDMTKTVYVITEYYDINSNVLNPIFTSRTKAEAMVKSYEERDRKLLSYYYPQYSIDDYDLVGDE